MLLIVAKLFGRSSRIPANEVLTGNLRKETLRKFFPNKTDEFGSRLDEEIEKQQKILSRPVKPVAEPFTDEPEEEPQRVTKQKKNNFPLAEFESLSVDSGFIEEITIDAEPEEFPSNTLVHRPGKNHVWGLGEEAKSKRKFFKKGEVPNLDALLLFLEQNKIEDLVVVPTRELGYNHMTSTSIVGTGFTNKHVYSVMVELSKQIKEISVFSNEDASFKGRKDDEWMYLIVADITVHLCSKQLRKDMKLEDIWMHKPSNSEMDEDFIWKMNNLKDKF